ncbi:MAG: hypothetical protein QGH39_07330 [Candidatus Thermoplasmatota archaeon]|jgi:hypothetical protein|nr:hypothetical protein [Candidatus Thermoplasmatota archaeon]MDP7265357.1 hypothetical protein [Candidatus Thermoplasmatota archaeon]MDP7422780.1 hypothetical protein [bacterium]
MKHPIVYYCEECGKTDSKKDSETLELFCCNRSMKKKELETCTKAGASAEHARFSDDDEPCDDGRG